MPRIICILNYKLVPDFIVANLPIFKIPYEKLSYYSYLIYVFVLRSESARDRSGCIYFRHFCFGSNELF